MSYIEVANAILNHPMIEKNNLIQVVSDNAAQAKHAARSIAEENNVHALTTGCFPHAIDLALCEFCGALPNGCAVVDAVSACVNSLTEQFRSRLEHEVCATTNVKTTNNNSFSFNFLNIFDLV